MHSCLGDHFFNFFEGWLLFVNVRDVGFKRTLSREVLLAKTAHRPLLGRIVAVRGVRLSNRRIYYIFFTDSAFDLRKTVI